MLTSDDWTPGDEDLSFLVKNCRTRLELYRDRDRWVVDGRGSTVRVALHGDSLKDIVQQAAEIGRQQIKRESESRTLPKI